MPIMRKCMHIACFLLGFFQLFSHEALADSPAAVADDVITPGDRGDHESDHHEPVAPQDRKFGVGDVDIYARYARAARGGSANGLTDFGTVGMDVHGLYGKQAGYAFGLGFELGTGID